MPNPPATLRGPFLQMVIERSVVRLTPWIEKFFAADLEAVRIVSRSARSTVGRTLAVTISRLGDGWLYPILVAIIFFCWGFAEFRLVLFGGLNAALLHCLYPIIKRRLARLRPFKLDRRLPSLLKTRDEHSFPSGHAMTLSGVLTPIVMVHPSTAISATIMTCCMAWARVASAHHFPSDIFVGALLGVAVGYPVSVSCLAYW